MRHHTGAGIGEEPVSGDVIAVIVRVDDERQGQRREPPSFLQQAASCVITGQRVDHDHSFVADDDAGIRVRALLRVRIVDGGPHAGADFVECEPGIRRRLRPHRAGLARKQEQAWQK